MREIRMNTTHMPTNDVQNKNELRVNDLAGDIVFFVKMSLLLIATVVLCTSAYV